MEPEYLDSFFRKIVPDEEFRFITFQKQDFHLGNLTILLFNFVPDSVSVTVDSALDIEGALMELTLLNPGTRWDHMRINYFDRDESGHCNITLELHLVEIPMRVNKKGTLIFKLK